MSGYKTICVCRYCLEEIMSHDKVSVSECDPDVEHAICDWCEEMDDDLVQVTFK